MDPETLASTAAQSLVTVLVTQAATAAKAKFAKLLSRRKPEAEVAAELERTQATLAKCPEDRAGEEYVWKREFSALLGDHPGVAHELRLIIQEAQWLVPTTQSFGNISQVGLVDGNNVQIQASGGVTIKGVGSTGRRGWWRR